MIVNKPPYVPLTMQIVNASPLSGLTHVSTFSGGGGTCIGFRLAGYRTLWANDVEAHARQCYRANLEAPIDGRDIRTITATDILTSVGLRAGELDVFEGSPPCTAFSTAGKRAKGWGQTKTHAGHTQTNVEDLFFEWLRLLDGLRPRAFMAENVAGMVRGVAKGYFKDVIRQMKALGYRTAAQILDAQWLGVPQRRTRVIFIGVRDDQDIEPRFPKPQPYFYSVRDALPWLTAARFDTGGHFQKEEFIDRASPTILASSQNSSHYQATGPLSRQTCPLDQGRSDRAIPMPPCRQRETGKAFMAVDVDPDAACPTVTRSGGTDLSLPDPDVKRRRFTMAELRRVCSFPDDYVMEGSYTRQWERLGNSIPPMMAYAIAATLRDTLLPR